MMGGGWGHDPACTSRDYLSYNSGRAWVMKIMTHSGTLMKIMTNRIYSTLAVGKMWVVRIFRAYYKFHIEYSTVSFKKILFTDLRLGIPAPHRRGQGRGVRGMCSMSSRR